MLPYSAYSSRRERPVSPKWKALSLIIIFAIFASLAFCLKGSFLGYGANNAAAADTPFFSWPTLCALATALLAAVGAFFFKSKGYRLLQQILNVGVLGFWTGTFLDYAVIVGTLASGFSFTLAGITTIVLMIVAFIYPLFGRKGHYCEWVCPMGSLQDLASRLTKAKFQPAGQITHYFELFRNTLWGVLMFLLWLGIGTEWIDNEIFTAFVVRSASWTVIIVGLLFILLSIFMPRPFCRMVCPLGTILRKSSDLEAK